MYVQYIYIKWKYAQITTVYFWVMDNVSVTTW